MADKRFKRGDVVQLKSGGPKMTVEGYGAVYPHVECQWSKLSHGQFEEDVLQLVTDNSPRST